MGSPTFFAEDLAFVAAVTTALNAVPASNNYYVQVTLREEGTHREVGAWCDEIAPDAWYFESKDAEA